MSATAFVPSPTFAACAFAACTAGFCAPEDVRIDGPLHVHKAFPDEVKSNFSDGSGPKEEASSMAARPKSARSR